METNFLITGINCAGCINKIDSKLRTIGVEKFDFDFQKKVAHIEYDKERTNPKEIEDTINKLGYHAYLKVSY